MSQNSVVCLRTTCRLIHHIIHYMISPGELGERGSEPEFSGLFAYHVPTNTWNRVMDDCQQLRSRIGHSMLFHPVS